MPRTRCIESVWSYPRPPAVEPCACRVTIEHGGELIADSTRALRVLETSHPPTIYLPPEDIQTELLEPSGARGSFCEWKGCAEYLDLVTRAGRETGVAWRYREPTPGYAALRDFIAFYPNRLDTCRLGDERVLAQAGDFYGGWVTRDLEGPFKGAPGTAGW
jgi:uncharacterized protein (DUF427 family)